MIQGNFICLRPVKQADLSLLEAWQNDVEIQSEYNAFGLKRFDNQERAFAEHGFLTDQLSTLMIVTRPARRWGR
ncbi:hypothetical protein [Candidatus Amarolinea dominans]|uniref:hypothetical protein n=1 Tax=Candidatus Amarolinea dominans TaxID=3140696 RepID=UPI0031354A8F|nr:hypothetical protein [Anaerolineae bacterium]